MLETIADQTRAAETSVRQLIANGKSKAALDRAKELHKQRPGAEAETLLVDAYIARTVSLLEHGMTVEAKALLDLVRQRYPAHGAKLDILSLSASARSGSLDALLAPLNDAELDPAKRSAIEQAIQKDVYDLSAIAKCEALSPEHPLRLAAAAIERAFVAATSGPVDAARLDLPEVSRRSPLASWKPLARAIGCLYRVEDEACREYLNAIAPGSAAARLVPAIQSALGDQPSAPLTGAASNLAGLIRANMKALRDSLEELERTLSEEPDSWVLRAVQTVFQQCRQNVPHLAGKLRQHVMVRCSLMDIDGPKIISAMGGEPRTDFYYYRLHALGMEQQHEVESLGVANTMWDHALGLAVKEGRFTSNGPEAAEIYLHMAEVIARTPRRVLDRIQRNARAKRGDDLYQLFPEKLYQRAAAIQPDSEVFSKWLEWAKRESNIDPEPVAEAWHKACPRDIQPVIYLMTGKASRNAYPTALKYLVAAERIDSVNPLVRMARVRLLTGSVLNYLRKKNPRGAEEKLVELAALPSMREADRPAFLAALGCLVARVRQDHERAESARMEVETLLGDRVAARILLCFISPAAKLEGESELDRPFELKIPERASIPAGLARTFMLGRYFGVEQLRSPAGYVSEAVTQFPKVAGSLSLEQIQCLAEEGIARREFELAYASAGAGMERGGGAETRFLLLRAQSIPGWQEQRKIVCAAAAAALARARSDAQTVEKAIEVLHELDAADFPIELSDASEVLVKEKAAREFPSFHKPSPDYSIFFKRDKVCQCPDCRRERGESVEDLDDFDDMDDFDEDDPDAFLDAVDIPPGIPPALGEMMLDEVRKAIAQGESPDEFMARFFGGGPPPFATPRKKKGKGK